MRHKRGGKATESDVHFDARVARRRTTGRVVACPGTLARMSCEIRRWQSVKAAEAIES